MPGAARAGADTAGGLILGGGQDFVTVEGKLWAVVPDPVLDHGDDEHENATMAQGSTFVTIAGVAPCLAGHLATCGHAATGSTSIGASE